MSDFRTYVALAAYPAIVIFVFPWSGEVQRWARENRSFFGPPELLSRAERTGRFLFFPKYALLLLVLRILARKAFWATAPILPPGRSVWLLISSGVIGGLITMMYRRIVVSLSPVLAALENQDYLLRGPILVWLMIFVCGALAEEFWRVLVIASFRDNGYSTFSAIAWPAFAFAIAHLSGLPARINGGLANVLPEMGVGVIFGLLFTLSGSLIPASIASTIYYTLNLFWLRRHAARLCAATDSHPD